MARAHASLLEIDPANDQLLATAPAAVTLRFSEPVRLNSESTRVLDDNADVVSLPATVSGNTVTIPLEPGLPNGTYTIGFSVISTDSHPINGLSVFHVGERTSAGLDDVGSSEVGPLIRLGVVVLSAIGYLGTLIAGGLVVMAWRTRRLSDDGDSDAALVALIARWERLCLRAVVFAAVCLFASVPFRIARIGGGLDALRDDDLFVDQLTGPIGVAVLVAAIGLFGVGVAIEQRGASAPAAGAALLACVGFALEGHTRGTSPRLLLMPSDVIHVAAASVWLGGVAGLAVALRAPIARRTAARIVAEFSRSAVIAVIVVTVTGVVLALRILSPDYRGLWSTGWGLALLVKVALVAVVVVLGWYNRARLVARVGDAGGRGGQLLRRIVMVEAVVLVAVVGTTSVLVTRSPVVGAAVPRAEASAEPSDVVSVDVALLPAVGSASIRFDPARVGTTTVTVTLRDTGGPLETVDPPQLSLSFPELGLGPLAVALEPIGTGVYRGTATLAYAGDWTVALRARPSDFVSAAGEAAVSVTE